MARRPHMALDPANFYLSIAMLLLVGVEGALIAEIVKGTADGKVWTAAAAILAAVIGLGIFLSDRMQRWVTRNRQFQRIGITRHVTRARVLVAFVSMKAGRNSAVDAALYHAGEGVLEHLWLLTSADALADAGWVGEQVLLKHPRVTVHPAVCVADIYSIPDAKDEVEKIRRQTMRKGMAESDIMCDFTGMTKHMSAGMIFACAPREARLQYMHAAKFLADGRADPAGGPSRPVEVEIAYELEEEV